MRKNVDLIFIDLDAYNSRFVEVIPFNDNIMISLNSLVDIFNIQTGSLDILSVHSVHVESMTLLSKLNVDM